MTSDALAPGALLQETYRITRLIGAGGMGEVYEATHSRLAGRYAVKLLLREIASNPDAFTRFKREAEITSGLRHPNIVQVLDFNLTVDGSPYLVMEYLEGHDLAARLGSCGRLSLPAAASLVDQVASALSAAHGKGVVHRDLKPQNVFLVPLEDEGRVLVKVLDFGISKAKTATQHLTRESMLMGTPQYMAPEQAQGRISEIDGRTDQFALAAMAYEVLAGRPAFSAEDFTAVLYQVVHEEPPIVDDGHGTFPVALDAVIRRGLAKRREDRFPTILEFARAFHDAASAVPARVRLGDSGGSLAGAGRVTGPTIVGVGVPDSLAATAMSQARPAEGANTLGDAAAEMARTTIKTSPMRSRAPRIAAAAGLLALLGAGGWLLARPTGGPPAVGVSTSTPAPTTALPAPPPSVRVSLDSIPQGASIHLAGEAEPVGTTPRSVELPKGASAIEVTLRRAGYRDAAVKIIPDQDKPVLAQLEPAPARSPKASPAPSPKRKKPRAKGPTRRSDILDDI